jgi:hypothetical protein
MPAPQAGMHPAMIAGLIAIPILLIVAIVLATGGKDEPAPKKTVAQNDDYRKEPPPPVTQRPKQPDLARPLTAREKAELEASWQPLRTEVVKWRKVVDAGFDAWKAENPEVMQEKFREANQYWRTIRDSAQDLLGQFTDEQIETYLDSYETELAQWGKIYQRYQKMVVPEK